MGSLYYSEMTQKRDRYLYGSIRAFAAIQESIEAGRQDQRDGNNAAHWAIIMRIV
jgi:hypothetical protein